MKIKARKDRAVARLFTRFPSLVERWARSQKFITYTETPWTPFFKEWKDARIALVTTAGVHLRSQPPFNMDDAEGDPTYREIPASIPVNELTITHNYYDHEDADRDINVVFPIERLRELESEGVIGEIPPRHFSFMGHILGRHVATLINQTGPEAAGMLREDGVDAVFLTPAWGTCNQSVGLIQRAIEAAGMATISISLIRLITEKVRPPRALLINFPLGHPLGNSFDKPLQRKILMEALRNLREITKPGTIVDFTEVSGKLTGA